MVEEEILEEEEEEEQILNIVDYHIKIVDVLEELEELEKIIIEEEIKKIKFKI